MNELIQLRQFLHQYPELSNEESSTSETILKHFEELGPDEVITFGKGGFGIQFTGKKPGPQTVFRAELDALPISEETNAGYASSRPGVSHACGHDGHMTILAGLGKKIAEDRPVQGNVLLLFQSAEETGEGAEAVMDHPGFKALKPGYIFALHNIPGVPMSTILIKEGIFAAASAGMTITMRGKTSHAAEPEFGINPDKAVAKTVQVVHDINRELNERPMMTFATVINIRLGEIAFGTSPGYAEVRLTLRSFEHHGINDLKESLRTAISRICKDQKLEVSFSFSEEFAAIHNHQVCTDIIRKAANENKLPVQDLQYPFRWSEDFGYYTGKINGGFFGLGSGDQQPALHNPDYDFPDALIEPGIGMFYSIYKDLHH